MLIWCSLPSAGVYRSHRRRCDEVERSSKAKVLQLQDDRYVYLETIESYAWESGECTS